LEEGFEAHIEVETVLVAIQQPELVDAGGTKGEALCVTELPAVCGYLAAGDQDLALVVTEAPEVRIVVVDVRQDVVEY